MTDFERWLRQQTQRRDAVGMLARALADDTADPADPLMRDARRQAADEHDGHCAGGCGQPITGHGITVKSRKQGTAKRWHPACWQARRLQNAGAPPVVIDRARAGQLVHLTSGREADHG